ncbi:hypothetical protein T440DRAFT_471849 [Plenodomus tracheiphilus IPT5]|uniref:Uncharacterized protein n=1 Tax=Plenodomus tracheiphilus IPT5 TaxID=1408161 RepID=A0A6A7ATK8_9PLEO|nr:hypothetical protein T440DRAFT_471849 [Plenodomus tracheiphilus IPT5]
MRDLGWLNARLKFFDRDTPPSSYFSCHFRVLIDTGYHRAISSGQAVCVTWSMSSQQTYLLQTSKVTSKAVIDLDRH